MYRSEDAGGKGVEQRSRTRERKHMKTYTKSVLSVLAALAVSATLTTSLYAAGNGAKGGAADLMQNRGATLDAAKVTVMTCPKCKTDYAVKTDWTERGANKPAKTVAKHLCAKCDTELKTVGVGKLAKDVAVHTCAACK